MIYYDCVQTPFIRAEFHNNPGESHVYEFETDDIVTLIVNGREQFVMQPGDSLHATIRYGENGRPEDVKLSGSERAVRQKQPAPRPQASPVVHALQDTITGLHRHRHKTGRPFSRIATFWEKANKLIKLESSHCSADFLNYLYAEYEAIVYGSYIEYPPLYADTRHVPIEKQGIGDYWNIINDYQPRADLASLRCMPYSEFLILYCFYKRTKEAHASRKDLHPAQFPGRLIQGTVDFLRWKPTRRNAVPNPLELHPHGKEIEKVEPYLKEYKEKLI